MNNHQIVILQRGWIVVGKTKQVKDDLVVENASVIRIWGTSKGIGELALSGPTTKTILDPCGTVTANIGNVVARIDVSPSSKGW